MTILSQDIGETRTVRVNARASLMESARLPLGEVVGIDLFAGAGGFSLGAHQAGVTIVAAVENQKQACATYRRNMVSSGRTQTVLFERDILDLDPFELMSAVNIAPSQCDIMLGGPPCQGFSAHRILDSGVDDPRNKLLIRYFEFVKAIRPRFFLVENVPGMLWPRHKKFVDAFYELAAKSGYTIQSPVVLNARDYGVPQNRKRVFLFGSDDRQPANFSWPPSATHVDPAVAGELPAWKVASSVFTIPVDADDENNRRMNHTKELVDAFKKTPLNGGSRHQSGRVLKCHKDHNGHSDVYGRIDPLIPGPTMTTACINPSKGRFVHPTEPHGISLRHAARFQTFPDWFVFEGGLMAAGAQIGNAVPVDMARALIEPLTNAVIAGRVSERPLKL